MSQINFIVDESCAALVLAAGKGTRMHSRKPKVLHNLLGEPLLSYVVTSLAPLFGDRIWAVVGHEADLVTQALARRRLHFVRQEEQLGTGHALMTALPQLQTAGIRRLLVLNGDTPLVTSPMLERFIRDAGGADLSVATLTLPSPGSYGRVVRHQDRVTAIVEAKDYDPKLHGPEPHEINAGIYMINLDTVGPLVPRLTNANCSGEYYITDLVRLAVAERLVVTGLKCGSDPSLLGVNTPAELAASEEFCRQNLVQTALEIGVVLHAPESVRLGPLVRVEPGAEISGPCEILGTSHIESGAVVEAFCHLRDTRVMAGAVIHGFSHLEEAVVGPDCQVGPHARLRPGTVMERGSKVGNFVEMKKARLGEGAKASHLTYLGDADVGPEANIGAGTITCNYDGIKKSQTRIGARAFIGSNTALVAPVSVGDDAIVGAGSVITKKVPDGKLVVVRGDRKIFDWKKRSRD